MKTDLKQDLKDFYRPARGAPVLVDVPEMSFLMVDGKGDPNTSRAFQDAIQALYSVTYTLKFALKRAEGLDFTVMPLEALWWNGADGRLDLDRGAPAPWSWTAMILVPSEIRAVSVAAASAEARRKRDLPALALLRFERFREGLAAQIMHVGPYSQERPTIEKLHMFIAEQGYRPSGKHHEVYLGDPRRSAPERLKTIVRQPVVFA